MTTLKDRLRGIVFEHLNVDDVDDLDDDALLDEICAEIYHFMGRMTD